MNVLVYASESFNFIEYDRVKKKSSFFLGLSLHFKKDQHDIILPLFIRSDYFKDQTLQLSCVSHNKFNRSEYGEYIYYDLYINIIVDQNNEIINLNLGDFHSKEDWLEHLNFNAYLCKINNYQIILLSTENLESTFAPNNQMEGTQYLEYKEIKHVIITTHFSSTHISHIAKCISNDEFNEFQKTKQFKEKLITYEKDENIYKKYIIPAILLFTVILGGISYLLYKNNKNEIYQND